MAEWSGKRLLVTGAGSGLGAATVAVAAELGCEVFALDVDRDAGVKVASETGATFIPCDVSSETDWQQVVELMAAQGGLDHVFLNAGIQSAPPEAELAEYQFAQMQLARYRKLMGVNVDGVVLGLHFLLPLVQPGGSVVVTGSLAGVVPYDIDPLYSMTKHAVTGLVRSLARELKARDLRINALCPAGIDTNIIPHEQRDGFDGLMSPRHVAEEVLGLFQTTETGQTWAKVSEAKPAWIIDPPGKKRK